MLESVVVLISCCWKDNLKCGGMLDCMVLASDSIESKKDNGSLGFKLKVAQCLLQPLGSSPGSCR